LLRLCLCRCRSRRMSCIGCRQLPRRVSCPLDPEDKQLI
jgi:hypothetical protein